MRISIDEKDRAYDLVQAKRVAQVTLDGTVVPAVTADEEEGYVLYFATDPATKALQTKMTPEGPEPILLEGRGKVKVTMRDGDWDASRRGSTKVEVGRGPDGTIHVVVHSIARPRAMKRYQLAPLDQPTSRLQLCQRVGIAAGAVAEALCEQFGDRIDPSACASVAVELCEQMLKAEERGDEGVVGARGEAG